MTCREKLAIERPTFVADKYIGGCKGCPSEYGYLADPEEDRCGGKENCTACWDREMPEENTTANAVRKIGDEIRAGVKKTVDCVKEDMDKAKKFLHGGSYDIPQMVVDNSSAKGPYEPHIKDSGDRTQFETGAVRDMREGKGRCDLMPLEVVAEYFRRGIYAPDPERAEDIYFVLWNICGFKNSNYTRTDFLYQALGVFEARCYDYTPTAFLEVAKHFEEGAKKYGENNWQKGIPVKCYIDSAIRHYLKWLRGDKDEPHDRAFVWNLMCCIWEVDYHKTEEG